MRNGNSLPSHPRLPLAFAIACLLGSSGYVSASVLDRGPTDRTDYGYVDAMMPPLPSSHGSILVQGKRIATGSQTAEFNRFLGTVNATTYEQAPRSTVANKSAFLEMKRYLQNRYNGLTVVQSVVEDGATFDCIPINEQPALRDGSAIASPAARSPIPHGTTADRSPAGEPCGNGTIPLERVDLDQLTHFATLRQFVGKEPVHRQPVIPEVVADAAASDGHHYASIFADMGGARIAGAGTDLDIWNPAFVTSNDYMSISQIWLTSGDYTQTLEVGWQRRPTYSNWGNKSILFIYSTQDGYVKTGCHNLECGQFVQTSSTPVFGVAFAASRYSSTNGAQGVVKVAFQRNTDGNWWLSVDNTWIGYYKASLYTGDLASPSASTHFSAGGETYANGGAPSTPMGSGVFAANGYKKAAFQANHFYIDDGLSSHAVTRIAAFDVSDPACYTLAVAGQSYGGVVTGVSSIAPSPEMTTGEGFYFGGPGCH